MSTKETRQDARAAAARSPRVGTKIVATLGPASRSPHALQRLLNAGAHVVRLNFSHGERAEHQETLNTVRAVAAEQVEAVAVMGDLCGPKIRLGKIASGTVALAEGDRLCLVRQPVLGNAERVSLNQPDIIDDVRVDHRVLIDDGAVRLRVVKTDSEGLTCQCIVGGTIRDHKGVNLPDSDLRMSALTEKDLDDVRWAAASGLDYIALSFVHSAEDVHALRRRLAELAADIHIVSKIETPQAVEDIDAIIEASDAILVARGDLGVEMDVERVPLVQKRIADRCRQAGKPVIVATQMLQSMVQSPVPTRAEVSDVANAIIDGADAVMLSAETAVGRYPVEAVEVMSRVAAQTEAYDQERMRSITVNKARPGVTSAVAQSVVTIAEEVNAKAVAVWTDGGKVARGISKHRLDKPVIALTPSEATRRRMALYYGITSVRAHKPETVEEQIAAVDRALTSGGWADAGDLVVVGIGPRSLECGDTGSISIHAVNAASAGATDPNKCLPSAATQDHNPTDPRQQSTEHSAAAAT